MMLVDIHKALGASKNLEPDIYVCVANYKSVYHYTIIIQFNIHIYNNIVHECIRQNRSLDYVVTVEPGCYFIDLLIDEALKDPKQAPHIDVNVLERYKPLGGVRIEDCVVVTKDGYENLTSAPKTIEEIEQVMG